MAIRESVLGHLARWIHVFENSCKGFPYTTRRLWTPATRPDDQWHWETRGTSRQRFGCRCSDPHDSTDFGTTTHYKFLVTTSSAFWTAPTRIVPRLHATVLLDRTPPMGTCARDPYVPEDFRPDAAMVHPTSTSFSPARGLPEGCDLRYPEPCVRNGGTYDGLVSHTSGTCTASLPTQRLRYTDPSAHTPPTLDTISTDGAYLP